MSVENRAAAKDADRKVEIEEDKLDTNQPMFKSDQLAVPAMDNDGFGVARTNAKITSIFNNSSPQFSAAKPTQRKKSFFQRIGLLKSPNPRSESVKRSFTRIMDHKKLVLPDMDSTKV